MSVYRKAMFRHDPYGKRSGISVERNGVPTVVSLVSGNADYDAITVLIVDGVLVLDEPDSDPS